MRKILILSCILAATASNAAGQDLQYRMTMQVSAAANPMISQMPATVSTISVKDNRVRMSMTLPTGMTGPGGVSEISNIIAADTIYTLLHDEAQYIRRNLGGRPTLAVDTAAQRKLADYLPKMQATGQTKMIAGRAAERMVWVVELPRGEAQAMPMFGDTGAVIIVGENWLATDSALNAAHRKATQTMKALVPVTNPLDAMTQQQADRFPLGSTTIFLRRPAGDYDIDEILAGEPGPNEIVRMTMIADEIKLAPLPDSLFEVPGNFTERN